MMEIENKWETIDKEPEVGDLVMYKCQRELPLPELGLVMQTYDAGMVGDELETAHIMWGTNDEEDELFLDLQVVSTVDAFYDS